ncbi:MAG: hypothetical protein Q4D29_10675 [Lachnospiraceae bacterium]|nr:hypothetical protein [Lachnospiraceae bacterium]
MFLGFIADAFDSIESVGKVIKSEVGVKMPEPQIHVGWDWEEGKPKLEIKDRDSFDFKKY